MGYVEAEGRCRALGMRSIGPAAVHTQGALPQQPHTPTPCHLCPPAAGHQRRRAEGDGQNGHLHHCLLPRLTDLRGAGPGQRRGQEVLHRSVSRGQKRARSAGAASCIAQALSRREECVCSPMYWRHFSPPPALTPCQPNPNPCLQPLRPSSQAPPRASAACR